VVKLLTPDECQALRSRWEKDIGSAAKDVVRVLDSYERLVAAVLAEQDARRTTRSGGKRLACRGVTRGILEWAAQLGVAPTAIWARLKRGLSEEESLSLPFDRNIKRFRKGRRLR